MLDSVLIPAEAPPGRALLIVLHGLGDSVHGWEWLPEALDLPWLDYLLVNAPDPYYGGHSWYDLHGDQGIGIRRSHALLHELLDAQVATGRPVDRIALLGFSQGCLMTFEAGWRATPPEPRAWLQAYAVRRYGGESAAMVAATLSTK
jgi:phospholipase/carboxylesterase